MKKALTLSCLLSLLLWSCMKPWTTTIQYGEIQSEEFHSKIPVEEYLGLLIVPVTVNGKVYRFLFDTGAMLSISKELQAEMKFEQVSKGNIVDSDKNRMPVQYVQLGKMEIGGVKFNELTAFVTDFKANPAIGCMKIDGILGSNLMRHCNWIINYEDKSISLTNREIKITDAMQSIPFKQDRQYNLEVDLKIGNVNIYGVHIDYGSNGSFSLSDKAFDVMLAEGVINKTFHQIGYSQSGITGKRKKINRLMAYSHEAKINGMPIDTVKMYSGRKGLIGKEVLSRYEVSIDWKRKQLHFLPIANADLGLKTSGLGVGKLNNNMIIQSVIKESNAYKLGVRSQMKIEAVNGDTMGEQVEFCKFIDSFTRRKGQLELVLSDELGKKIQVELKSQKLD